MIKAVIFDFWGTIVEVGVLPPPVRQVKNIMRLDIPFSDFIIKFEEAFMLKKFDTLKEAFENVGKSFGIRLQPFVIEKLVGMWNKNMLLAKPFAETVEVIENLRKKGYKIALVSNTEPFSVEPIIDKFDLRKHFNIIMLSYETGMLKTNPEMFHLVLRKLKVKPDEAVMVGDSIESDILSAEKTGIRAILVDRRGNKEYDKEKISNLNELNDILK